MDWMLQKKEREKLWLNTYLLQQNTDTVAVKQVVKELGWSRYLVQSNGIDLVRDLQALQPDAPTLIAYDEHKKLFSINAALETAEHALRLHYLHQSLRNLFLNDLFFERLTSLEYFAERHNTSISTAREIKLYLAKNLAQFDISISDDLKLVGNERGVRQLGFQIVYHYYAAQEEPFPAADRPPLKAIFETFLATLPQLLPESAKLAFYYQFGIWHFRIAQGHQLHAAVTAPLFRPTATLTGPVRQYTAALTDLLCKQTGLSADTLDIEIRYAMTTLVAMGFIPEATPADSATTETLATLAVFTDIIQSSYLSFFKPQEVLETTVLATIGQDLYPLHLRLLHFNQHPIDSHPNIMNAYQFYPLHTAYTLHVLRRIATRFKLSFETVYKTLFTEYLNTFIDRLPREQIFPLLTVTVDLPSRASLARYTKRLLADIFGANILVTNHYTPQSDLYIADFALTADQSRPGFVWQEIPTIPQITMLYNQVHTLTIQKFEQVTGNQIERITNNQTPRA